MMLKTVENGEVLEGNDRYTGFCKELADKIANTLGITCKFCSLSPRYCFEVQRESTKERD